MNTEMIVGSIGNVRLIINGTQTDFRSSAKGFAEFKIAAIDFISKGSSCEIELYVDIYLIARVKII